MASLTEDALKEFASELLCNGHSQRLSTGLMDQQLNLLCQISASGNSVPHGNLPVFFANVYFVV